MSEGSAGNSLFEITNNIGSAVVGTDTLLVTAIAGSAAVNARNGLSVNSNYIELGGAFTKNTQIGGDDNQFYYSIDNGDDGATFRNTFYMNSSQANMSMNAWEYNHTTM